MPAFADWLDHLLTIGEAVMDGPPAVPPAERDAALDVLDRHYRLHALDVAGPPLPFEPAVALAAAEQVAVACWRLLTPEDGTPLRLAAREPGSPAAHLSADLTLRFLPAVHLRARLRAAGDPLVADVAELLRRWPLSGVLADLGGPPAIQRVGEFSVPYPLDFGGHTGLQLLYAERLFDHEHAAWVPPAGPAREQAERVYQERGRSLPHPITTEEAVA
jgi:hypothetical protein